MSPKIVVVGSLVTDYVTTTPRFPRPGETVFGHAFKVGFGGKGANQCLAASRLGAATAFVGKLGNDLAGDNFISTLKDTTIDTRYVTRTNDAQSACANVTVDDKGENCIVNIPGANLKITEDDVYAAADVIRAAAVLVTQNEITLAATRVAQEIAREAGVVTLHNAGPCIPNLDPRVICNSDILCVNETEAEELTGITVQSVSDSVEAGKALLGMGCKGALITMGSQGAIWLNKDTLAHGNPGYEWVKTEKVKAVDTTGAGDAFIGSLAYFLACMPSLPMKDMMARSCAVATKSVLSPGAWESLPTRETLPESLFKV